MSEDQVETTRRMAESHGLEFSDCGGGHVQIKGNGVLVNYYPVSRKRTAYCPDTGERLTNCTPYNACKIAMRGKGQASDLRPKAHRKPRKNGPPEKDTKPATTNPTGIRHFYDGDVPPWDESLGPFQFEADSDRMRYQALRKEDEAVAMRAKADQLDQPESV